MVFRLSIVTALLALFAVGFSALVQAEARGSGALVASIGCFDRGAVCTRPAAD